MGVRRSSSEIPFASARPFVGECRALGPFVESGYLLNTALAGSTWTSRRTMSF
jgi:hypothetical protein